MPPESSTGCEQVVQHVLQRRKKPSIHRTETSVRKNRQLDQARQIWDYRLGAFDDEEIAILNTYLNQPALKSLPIMAKIAELKKAAPSRLSQEHIWPAEGPDQCTSETRPNNLMLDTGRMRSRRIVKKRRFEYGLGKDFRIGREIRV